MFVCLLCLGLMVSTAAYANLITNGSFEEGNYTNNGGGYTRLGSGSNAITGWTVGENGLDWHIIVGDSAHFGRNSINTGNYAVDLSRDGGGGPYSISQSFATTIGTDYTLSFLLGAPWFDTAVTATVGGASQTFSLAAQDQYGFPWVTETLSFTADNVLTTLTFESVNGGWWAPVIDNVSVEAAGAPVPEPSTFFLLGAGLAGVGFLRRKSRS